MNFIVNSVNFFSEMNLNDNIHIKSSKKVYEVSYSNKNVEQLVNDIYKDDDFIFIPK